MRILCVGKGVPWQARPGGEFVFAYELNRHLAELGHEITWLAAASPEDRRDVDFCETIWVTPGGNKWFPIRLYQRVRKRLGQFDIVHTHGGEGFYFARAARRGKAPPTLRTQHFNPRPRPWLRESVWRKYERHGARYADAVCVPSEYAREQTATVYGIPPDRIHIVKPGVRQMPHADAMRQKHSGKRSPVLLSIGNLGRGKGTDLLIEAAAIAGKSCEFKLRIMGDMPTDEYKRQVGEAGIAHLVEFVRPVPYDDLPGFFGKADIFVSASRSETFGMAVAEAMAWGLPVVAFGATAIPEVVEDGVQGILVREEDAQGMAEAIVRLCNDLDLRAQMGIAGVQRAISEFNWRRTAEESVGIYTRLLSSRQVSSD